MTFLPSVNPVRSELLWVCAAARKRSKWPPRLNIPQARLLDEFESMFPEPALSASSQQSVEGQTLPVRAQLRFQHDCE